MVEMWVPEKKQRSQNDLQSVRVKHLFSSSSEMREVMGV